MDIELLKEAIQNQPIQIRITIPKVLEVYNQNAPIQITKRELINTISQYPELHNLFISTKEEREKKITLALQEAEDQLIQNASMGDIKSIEFLLKSLKKEYQQTQELKVTLGTSEDFIRQIQKKKEDIMDADIVPQVQHMYINKETK